MFFFLNKKLVLFSLLYIIVSSFIGSNKSSAAEFSKGIGPIKELKIENISFELATTGKNIFISKCSMCHKIEERYVGPALKGVTNRRAPEWIMNMILNTEEMVEQDPIAQELLGEYLVKMTSQNVTQSEARSILEYFRYYEDKGEIQAIPKQEEIKNKKQNSKKSVIKK